MAEKETKEKPTEETVEFMGKQCTVVRHSDGTTKASMKKADYESILDGFGVTKEVRAKQKEVDDIITENAAKFLEKSLMTSNKGKKEDSEGFVRKAALVLGGGNCCMKFDMQPVRRHSSVDPESGKPRETVKYGTFKVTKCYAFANELRRSDGLLDQIAQRFEKEFGAKKK